ncbi:ABC transporter permease [Corallococcus sp. ZKHCc1 1396]|uniref:ABC transporter permease n=1 Tax=Corallococcus soli TaxID=2710757 RepID=A0ABR9PSM8_9BACT|nr:FtsX-like permease family protein [Corallococcus soli]MBE4750869.1 ABC transporter permease [Corallococcus soli]
MSTLVRLALRNLWRNPRRTALTSIAIVAGIGVFILGEGFVGGVEENILATAIQGTVGHVLVRPPDYPTQPGQHPVDVLVRLPEDARALIEAEAVAWTGRLLFAPTAVAGMDSLRVMGIGYDPEGDARVFPRDLWRVDGALPRPGAAEVAVSFRVARLLRLQPGDRMILQARTHEGALNALEVTVSGRVGTSNPALDALGVFVPRQLARELVATDLPSHVAITLRDRDDAPAFAARLQALLGAQAGVATWRQETAELLQLQAVRRKALDLVVFILLALAGFGIANTLLMAAHERVREVGTLRAMGMSEGAVARLFLVEGAVVGGLGSLLGALLGGGAVAWWAKHPLDFSATFEKQGSSLPISAWIHTRFDLTVVLAAVGMGIAVAVLASLHPARVASRRAPADAVRAA